MSRYKAAPDRLDKLQQAAHDRKEEKKRIKAKAKARDKREYATRVREFKRARLKAKPETKSDPEFFRDFLKAWGHYHELDPRYVKPDEIKGNTD